MTRNELKQMWFNLPTQTKVTKTILVEMNKNKFHWKGYGYVSITSDGPDGYSHFATHEEHQMEYALNRMKQDKYKEYKLIVVTLYFTSISIRMSSKEVPIAIGVSI